jgi:hypothetical protein
MFLLFLFSVFFFLFFPPVDSATCLGGFVEDADFAARQRLQIPLHVRHGNVCCLLKVAAAHALHIVQTQQQQPLVPAETSPVSGSPHMLSVFWPKFFPSVFPFAILLPTIFFHSYLPFPFKIQFYFLIVLVAVQPHVHGQLKRLLTQRKVGFNDAVPERGLPGEPPAGVLAAVKRFETLLHTGQSATQRKNNTKQNKKKQTNKTKDEKHQGIMLCHSHASEAIIGKSQQRKRAGKRRRLTITIIHHSITKNQIILQATCRSASSGGSRTTSGVWLGQLDAVSTLTYLQTKF